LNFKKIIREELESDDLKWIEDTEPDDYSFNYRDKVVVHNIGNEASFLKWLGQERNQKNYKNGVYGVNITGTIWDVYTDDFSILEKNTGDVIYFPNNKMMSSVQGVYPGLSIYYELIPE
jgi:hypothetical protein